MVILEKRVSTGPSKQCKSLNDVLILRQYLEKNFFCGGNENWIIEMRFWWWWWWWWYWVSIGRYWLIHDGTGSVECVLGQCNLLLIGFEWYWVNKGLQCLYILRKKKISGDDNWRTDQQGKYSALYLLKVRKKAEICNFLDFDKNMKNIWRRKIYDRQRGRRTDKEKEENIWRSKNSYHPLSLIITIIISNNQVLLNLRWQLDESLKASIPLDPCSKPTVLLQSLFVILFWFLLHINWISPPCQLDFSSLSIGFFLLIN